MRLKLTHSNKIEDFIQRESLSKNKPTKVNKILFSGFLFVLAVIWMNLFSLQVLRGGDYLAAANQNYKDRTVLRAPRGVIFDSNQKKLVYNTLKYNIYIDLNEFDISNVEELSSLTGMDVGDIKERLSTITDSSIIRLMQNLEHDKYLDLVGEVNEIKGIFIIPEINRAYKDSHIYTNIIGYIGDASHDDLMSGIDEHSRVGKTGIEKVFDTVIRGKDGIQVEEKSIGDGSVHQYIPSTAEAGKNITLNIDSEWQESAYRLLSEKSDKVNGLGGAFVIMDIETGAIKSLVSYPTVDIDQFSLGVSEVQYKEVLEDPRTPLLDRSYGVALPTGSIFKVLTAVAGLEEGVIDESSTYYSDSCMSLPGGVEFCESLFRKLGDVNIYTGLTLSSNIYFCNVGLELTNTREGIDTLKLYTDSFDIGKVTGVDLPGESGGSMASRELKLKIYSEPWYLGDICNTVVGQGMVTATPLQMAVVMAGVENGGNILKPQLLKSINNQDGSVVQRYEIEIIKEALISDHTAEIIRTAMRRAVTDSNGTLRKLSGVNTYVTGKTGTATAPVKINNILYDEPHAWVMGIFEHEGRKYSYVVNIAHGGWGEGAVDVIKEFLDELTK